MLINNYIQTAINQIQSQKNTEIEKARQKAQTEKIIPFNNEIETSKQKAISELTQQYNEKVSQLQKELEAQKKEICDASEKKKSDFASMTLLTAETEIEVEYQKVLSDLTNILNSVNNQ